MQVGGLLWEELAKVEEVSFPPTRIQSSPALLV